MKPSRSGVLFWLVVALLALLVWLTVTGRLGQSRHGYTLATVPTGASQGAAGEAGVTGIGALS